MMEHRDDHDPLTDYQRCYVCYAALSSAWARLTGLPIDTMEETIRRMRETAKSIANGLRAFE